MRPCSRGSSVKSIPRTTWAGWNYQKKGSVCRLMPSQSGCAYHDLLCLGEIVAWVHVQSHLPNYLDRHKFFRDNLGGIEEVKSKSQLVGFFHDLNSQFIFRPVSRGDCVPEVLSMEVGVLACQHLG